MVQPINYGALQTAVNPLDSFTSAFKQGAGIRQVLDLREQEAQNAILAQQQAQAQQAMQAELAAVANNPQATAADYSRLMTKYPALSENLKRSWDTLNADQQKNSLTSLSKVSAAFSAGKPEIAVKVLREQAEALRNSGDEAQAKRVEDIARMTEIDPSVGRSIAFSMVAAVPGGDKIIEGLSKVGTEARAQELQAPTLAKAKAEAEAKIVEAKFAERVAELGLQREQKEIQNINSQIADRANRLKLDRDRLNEDIAARLATVEAGPKMDAPTRKLVDDAVVNSITQGQAAEKMKVLADEFETKVGGWGAFSWAAEGVKKATGTQGDVSALRQEYARIRNSLAVKSLPPGPATDKDIELAMRGFPGDNANGKVIAKFLRGMSKMAAIDARVSSAKADWINANGGMVPARAPAEIAGVKVTPGMKFEQVAKQIAEAEQVKEKDVKPTEKPMAEPQSGKPIEVNY